MLNLVAKSLLVLTSLSPVLLVWAVNEFESGGPCVYWIWPLIAAFLLAYGCEGLLKYAQDAAQEHRFHVEEFDSKDQEVLTFLFVYLLPFVRGSAFASEWLTTVVALAIIVTAIVQTDAFHFNPVMRFFGYRFYSVKDKQGLPGLLISKTNLRRTGTELLTVRLASGVYLQKESVDA